MKSVERDWERVQRLRQKVRDAKDIRARLNALFLYQGELHIFVERHGDLINMAVAMVKMVEAKAA